jgi:hypothetical protein
MRQLGNLEMGQLGIEAIWHKGIWHLEIGLGISVLTLGALW